jgi:hypothetical protein
VSGAKLKKPVFRRISLPFVRLVRRGDPGFQQPALYGVLFIVLALAAVIIEIRPDQRVIGGS